MKAIVLPPQPAWSEVEWCHRLRCVAEALGITNRRTLLQQSRPPHEVVPELARQVLNDLLNLTELAGGTKGAQVSPSPWRKIHLGGDWWVSLGGPARLPQTSSIPSFLRVVQTSCLLEEAREVKLDLWLDPYRNPLTAVWLEQELPRNLGYPSAAPAKDLVQIYDASRSAPHQEGRWRTPRSQENGKSLLRWRGANGRPEHYWGEWQNGQISEARALRSDIACQARYFLDQVQKNPILCRIEPIDPDCWGFWCPSWLPRAEYRLLRALCSSRPSSVREPWKVPASLAGTALQLLRERIGVDWEGPDL